MAQLKADKIVDSAEIFLGIGGNIGNPVENVQTAFKRLASEVFSDAEISSLYVTEPQDVHNQPKFINAVCRGLFSGSPLQLLSAINNIEKTLGRNRSFEQRRGPRMIDIDILLFGNFQVNYGIETDGEGCWLRIPHDRLNQRQFALIPLLDLAPDIIDPCSGRHFSEIADSLEPQGIYSFDKLRYIKSHGGTTDKRNTE